MSTSATDALSVGDMAPDFITDSTAGPVTLSSFRGSRNVLLAFFPLAFTSTCTAELCDMSMDFEQFVSSNVEVLPISVDSVPTLKEFRAKHDLSLTLLSDFKRNISRSYGVLIPERFYSNRAYFLIDDAGRITWMHVEDSPGNKRTNQELLEQIALHS